MKIKIKILAFYVFLSALISSFANEISSKAISIDKNKLPQITKLNSRDYIFKQFSDTVKYNDLLQSKDEHSKELIMEFYSYKTNKYDDVLSIHADTGIPYDTLVTLNQISSTSQKLNGRTLILPTEKGLFIKKEPKSSFELMIYKELNEKFAFLNLPCYNLENVIFYFVPGARLSNTARAFYLDSGITLPLDTLTVTSGFGYRTSPIYNTWKFHKGVDFAAKEGTYVYACKNGKVALCIQNDKIFGNYIILSHDNGMTSVYAHLSKIMVKNGDIISSGKVIGLVGQTGAATGPHLHFEIRQNGVASDPLELLGEN